MSDAAVPVEVEAAVDVWDEHVARCGRCLTVGNNLCEEGEYLAEDVEIVREKVTPAPPPRARRRLFLPPLRRFIVPGVPA